MEKPTGYEEVQAFTGDFEVLEIGGYIAKIIKAEVKLTKNNLRYLEIYFDICEGEKEGYFKRKHDEASKGEKEAKWQGVFRQFIDGNSTPYFKGVIKNIENSNFGYDFKFDLETLKGKIFGAVFGREEYLNNFGEKKMYTKCRFIRDVESVRSGITAPIDKLLPVQNFANEFEISHDDDLPF